MALAAIWFLVSLVNNRINNTLDPLQQANHELGTQVANLLNPTPTIIPDPVTIIHDVQSLARLETIRYTVEKIITAEHRAGIRFSATGCYSWRMVGSPLESTWARSNRKICGWTRGVLNVRLPAAEVFDASLDNDKIVCL